MNSIGTHSTILHTFRTWHHRTFTSSWRWRSTLLVNDMQMMRTCSTLSWLNSQAALWYEEGISKLVSRYDKCLNVQGDYHAAKVLRDEFHWDTFDHPPYSPDLAPSDFHLILKMKEHLAGKRHADDEDLQHAVVDWLNSQAAVWDEEGISKLVSRYDKCLNVQGDNVKK